MAEGNIAKGTGAGALKGAAIGAKIGTAIPIPGVGTAVGAAAGAIVGGISGGVKSKKAEDKKKDAAALIPGLEDPTQTARLAEVDRIAKNIQSGTDSATQTAIQAGQQTVGATQNRLSRVTGGNVGGTVDALIKSQRAGGEAANTALAQGQQRLPFFMNLGQQIANKSEQRKLELQLLERAQLSAEGAQATKEQNVDRNALLASGVGTEELAGAGAGATDRIKSLLNNINLNKGAEGGGGTGSTGPVNILPGNEAPSVGAALGTVNPGGQEVGGLNMGSFAGIGSAFGG